MQTALLSLTDLTVAIHNAFAGDEALKGLYDPAVRITTTEDMVRDVVRKVRSFAGARYYGVMEQGLPVGFIVAYGDHSLPLSYLVSFGLNRGFRSEEGKEKFFHCIRSVMGGSFLCCLWNQNQRGIKWLEKMGMRVIEKKELYSALLYDNENKK